MFDHSISESDEELIAEARKRYDAFIDRRLRYVGGFFSDIEKTPARRRKITGQPPFSHHVRVFADRLSKERIFTSQPYLSDLTTYRAAHDKQAALDEFARASQEFADQHGLTVEISAEKSWYRPGESVLIVYRKK